MHTCSLIGTLLVQLFQHTDYYSNFFTWKLIDMLHIFNLLPLPNIVFHLLLIVLLRFHHSYKISTALLLKP